jgi:hypothetical protein
MHHSSKIRVEIKVFLSILLNNRRTLIRKTGCCSTQGVLNTVRYCIVHCIDHLRTFSDDIFFFFSFDNYGTLTRIYVVDSQRSNSTFSFVAQYPIGF